MFQSLGLPKIGLIKSKELVFGKNYQVETPKANKPLAEKSNTCKLPAWSSPRSTSHQYASSNNGGKFSNIIIIVHQLGFRKAGQ